MIKKILCLILTLIILLTCAGCKNSIQPLDEPTQTNSIFIKVEDGVNNGYQYSVVYHKDTKVMYTVSYHTVFTVMLDADGKPLLYEEKR